MPVALLNSAVLLLNENYAPLNICNVRRAFGLLAGGKAELLVNGHGEVHTFTKSFPIPSVIRLMYLIRRPIQQHRISRREVFLRDSYTCQYCGKPTRELTLDHVIPRHLGGAHAWENVVTACIPCNHRKAGHNPKQAGMRLSRDPRAPRPHPYTIFHHHQPLEEWRTFVPWLT